MARVMSKKKWDATLVFIAVAGEEQGLFGSTHWAKMAKEKNWDIAGMITNDIIGSSHADDGRLDDTHVRLFAEGVPPTKEMSEAERKLVATGGENDSAPRELARFVKTAGDLYVPNMTVNIIYRRDRYLRGGDHIPFLAAGYPAVRMTEPNENFHHQHQDIRKENGIQYGDLPEFDDFNYIAQVARVNAAALGALALAPARPQRRRDRGEGIDQRHHSALATEQGAGPRRLRNPLAGNHFAGLAGWRSHRQRHPLYRPESFQRQLTFLASPRSIAREIAARRFTRCRQGNEVFPAQTRLSSRKLICT